MTPKEKAKELIEKFKFETKKSEIINDIILGDISVIFQHHKAKQCALISIDQLMTFNKELFWINEGSLAWQYFENVKKEIEQL